MSFVELLFCFLGQGVYYPTLYGAAVLLLI